MRLWKVVFNIWGYENWFFKNNAWETYNHVAYVCAQDTGSSNGTFINNIRLSKCGEQSKLTEIYSEDTLRFGSDVVDKAKNVTQKCVVVALRLWYPDGLEYDSRPTSSRLYRKKINKSLFIVLPRVYRKGALNNKSSLTHFDFQTANWPLLSAYKNWLSKTKAKSIRQ